MLEEKAQDLMVDMLGLLPLIVNNALNVTRIRSQP